MPKLAFMSGCCINSTHLLLRSNTVKKQGPTAHSAPKLACGWVSVFDVSVCVCLCVYSLCNVLLSVRQKRKRRPIDARVVRHTQVPIRAHAPVPSHTYTQGQTHVNKRRSLYMNTSITSPPLISLPSPPHFCLQKTMHATHLRSWNFGLCSGAALKQRVRISCIASWHLQWQWANQFMA